MGGGRRARRQHPHRRRARSPPGETEDPPPRPTTTTTPESTCTPLPYQPCGQANPAPGTDGTVCLAGFEDYDEDPANGCEAADDGLPDDAPFPESMASISGTIVPRDDVDTFAMDVGDGYQLLCDGTFTVTLTAPEGMTLRLEVLDGDALVDETTSADGIPSGVSIGDPDCLFSDARVLIARVSPIGTDRNGRTYLLERAGSF